MNGLSLLDHKICPLSIAFPVNFPDFLGSNLLEFCCPCNPKKLLTTKEFINHVFKKHKGKTPIFYMTLDE